MKKEYVIGGLIIAAAIGGYFWWQSYESTHKLNYTAQVWQDRKPCC